MHLKSLKIFCDIVDNHSFSRAAKANGVSQSNASQVVHHLEEHLGVQLIDRSKRPFVLTPEGQRFHEGCRVIVQRYDDLVGEVRALHEVEAARLIVASIYSVGLAHMSRYLREFLAENPKADVRLEYVHPQRVYEAVDSGAADLGLVSYPEESRSLAALPWRTEPMVLVCHPQHRLAALERASLAELADEPFVAFQEGLRIRQEIDRMLENAKIAVDVELEFDNIETIKRAIEIGTGISLLPEPTIAREVDSGLLVKLPLDGEPLVRPLGIIHRRDRKLSETAKKFVHLLQTNGMQVTDATPAELRTSASASNGHAAQHQRSISKGVSAHV